MGIGASLVRLRPGECVVMDTSRPLSGGAGRRRASGVLFALRDLLGQCAARRPGITSGR